MLGPDCHSRPAALFKLTMLILSCEGWLLARCQSHRQLLPDGTSLQYELYAGAAPWQLFPNLWIDATVIVTCPDNKVGMNRDARHPRKLCAV